jgi:hypothetical protein
MSHSQNDARLEELAGKVSALRGVTIDINRQAADHSFIDANVCIPPTIRAMLTSGGTIQQFWL